MAEIASPANGVELCLSQGSGARIAPERAFLGVAGLLFAAAAAATALWWESMSAMEGMPMPGGWTMSMAWIPMCGQTWLVTAASFVGMWTVMMVAMMLPSLVPMLMRYRHAVDGAGKAHLGPLTALVGVGYFIVWAVLGAAVFLPGARLAAAVMEEPLLASAVPLASGVVVAFAGMVQFTEWKLRRVAHCHEAPGCCNRPLRSEPGAALRHGLRLGVRCSIRCSNFTVILLVMGVMDLHVMAFVTAALSAERLLPASESVVGGIGIVVVSAGVLLIARAALA